ncbi:MAG TPA: DUF1028 domain-containing protein [Thermoplasmata archaeon]|nr:DUF1028 domain-containing protein [Thermoplasmata archaeon]
MTSRRFGTFSIVAVDRDRAEWGVAVQSRFIAVGAVVPWAEAKVGALATQALANVTYGPRGLELLRDGARAPQVVQKLTAADPEREDRQVGVVDRHGGSAAFTGSKCLPFAGHRVGDGFAAQGNILLGEPVVESMARTFETTPGDLPERLLASLAAGQREGGDRRGMQSAALLVVRPSGGYSEGNDRWIDIRVDDHPSPIEELQRVFALYDLTLLAREDPDSLVRLDGEVAQVVQQQLKVLGYYTGGIAPAWGAPAQAAFSKFLNEQNFENKARTDGTAWPSILNYLQERAQSEVERRSRTAPIVPGALDHGPGASGGGGASPSGGKSRSGERRR